MQASIDEEPGKSPINRTNEGNAVSGRIMALPTVKMVVKIIQTRDGLMIHDTQQGTRIPPGEYRGKTARE
jgi:hypothetical protein